MAAIVGHHGLGRRRGRAARRVLARHTRAGAAPHARRGGRLPRPPPAWIERYRSFRLPSRRRQSADGARRGLRPRRRCARRRARRAARVRKHVGGDGALRARALIARPRRRAAAHDHARPRFHRRIPGRRGGVSAVAIIVALVAAERAAELILAARNTRALLARGGVEVGAGHYPLLVLLHGAWLATLLFLVPADAPPAWGWLGAFAVAQ